jgi:hypothetical protein
VATDVIDGAEAWARLGKWPAWCAANSRARVEFCEALKTIKYRPTDSELATMWHWYLRGWNANRRFEVENAVIGTNRGQAGND